MSDSQDDTSNASYLEEIRGEDFYVAFDSASRGEESTAPEKKCISVGEYLPYGLRLFHEDISKVVRMKDIGVKNRIILVGVIGSFTPDCWNRHLFQVLKKRRYYQERYIAHICCISTNDAFTQAAWGEYLGCQENVLMWSDTYKHFTKKIGMDIVVPWLDNTIRSKRYVIFAEDMMVTKMIVAPKDCSVNYWECEHLIQETTQEDDNEDDEISI